MKSRSPRPWCHSLRSLSLSLSLSARSTRNGGKRWKLWCLRVYLRRTSLAVAVAACEASCASSVCIIRGTELCTRARTPPTTPPCCKQVTNRPRLRPTNEWKSFSGKESRKWSANVFREGTVYGVRFILARYIGDARQAVH